MSSNLSPLTLTLSVALLTLIIPSGDSTVLKVVSLLERNELVLTTPCKFNPDPLSRKVSDELEVKSRANKGQLLRPEASFQCL